jgi:acyl carrier protein
VATTVDMAAVGSDIRGFIAAKHPHARFADTDDIFTLGFVSSLFAMQLVLFLEQHFAVQIPNDQLSLRNLSTVAAMSELVRRCRSAG